VLCAVCCVLCAVCYVLCAVCCVLCAVCQVVATDVDEGDVLRYSLLKPAPLSSVSGLPLYQLSPIGQLLVRPLDFEAFRLPAVSQHNNTVRVVDAAGLHQDSPFTIVIGDVNELPLISGGGTLQVRGRAVGWWPPHTLITTLSVGVCVCPLHGGTDAVTDASVLWLCWQVSENSPPGTLLGHVTVSDPDNYAQLLLMVDSIDPGTQRDVVALQPHSLMAVQPDSQHPIQVGRGRGGVALAPVLGVPPFLPLDWPW
jgi:hypothetical protein